MCGENGRGPIGIVAGRHNPLVTADDVDRTPAQPFQTLASDVSRRRHDDAGGVEIQADALHGGCARHPQHQFEHVDAVVPEFQPQPLGEDPGERLHAAVHGVPRRSEIARERTEHHDAAAPPGAHRLAVVMGERQRCRHIEVDDPLKCGQIAVEELVAVGIRAGDQDQQPDLEFSGRCRNVSACAGVAQIRLHGPYFATMPPTSLGGLFQCVSRSGDQYEIQARFGEKQSELGADAF
jgi:hypothetical protein